jgi:hypothetical protein
MSKNFKNVKQFNFFHDFSDEVVDFIKLATGVKSITTGDKAVPKYKHVVSRVAVESMERVFAGTTKKIDIEYGCKFDENLRTLMPDKFGKTILSSWFYPAVSGQNEFYDQFNKSMDNSALVGAMLKKYNITPSSFKIFPIEAGVPDGCMVGHVKDAIYYTTMANAMYNKPDGFVLHVCGWTMGVGEYFGGEIVVEETDDVDRYGRRNLRYVIAGESGGKVHPRWEFKYGYQCEQTRGIEDYYPGADEDLDAMFVPADKPVYFNVKAKFENEGLYRYIEVTKVSEAQYVKHSAKTVITLETIIEAQRALRRRAEDGCDDDACDDRASVTSSSGSRGTAVKRLPLTASQIAAKADVNYSNPNVTSARVNAIILEEYPGCDIEFKSDMCEAVMALICAHVVKRKGGRNGLTEAVLNQWKEMAEPASSPVQGAKVAVYAGVYGAIKSISDKFVRLTSGAGKAAKPDASNGGKCVKPRADTLSIVGSCIMPIVAMVFIIVFMFVTMAMVFMFMFSMYRRSVRTATFVSGMVVLVNTIMFAGAPQGEGYFGRVKSAFGQFADAIGLKSIVENV